MIHSFILQNVSLKEHSKKANILIVGKKQMWYLLIKKESKTLIKNYRPINLLTVLGKIFERLIYKDLFHHLFCIFPLLSVVHEINSFLDCNPTIDVRGIFVDISKAFHKVWMERLLFKLELYGIGGDLLNLFKDYLQERQQRVVLNGQSSSWEVIKFSVP